MSHIGKEMDNLRTSSPTNNMFEISQNSQEHDITADEYDVDDFDEDCLIYALFCFEDVPLEMIEDVLQRSVEEVGECYYWLADHDYSTLPQSEDGELGTRPPLPRSWRSPFLGSSLKMAFEHVKNAPGRLLNRKHIVVLDKELFGTKKMLRIYRREGFEPDFADELGMNIRPGDITEVGGYAYTTIVKLIGYDRETGTWGYQVSDWKSRGLRFNK